jgi:hypothetical protein
MRRLSILLLALLFHAHPLAQQQPTCAADGSGMWRGADQGTFAKPITRQVDAAPRSVCR